MLVFHQTRSALLASIAFAASIVPSFLGGLLLSGIADRRPRRQVMIACDLSRALLVAVMALPGMPTVLLVALLFLVTIAGAPFISARAALYPDILRGDSYVLGTAVTLTTLQFAQVLGFAAGGALVAFFGVRTSLVIDAVTFILSAVITRLWVRSRPAPRQGPLRTGAIPRPPARASSRASPMLMGYAPGSAWCLLRRLCWSRCCSAGYRRSTTCRRGSPRRWQAPWAGGRWPSASSWRRGHSVPR